MSSSWGKKLEKKLNGLADTASKDSVQTLAKWIAFNRKHAPIIATVLTNNLRDSKANAKRQWMHWRLIHLVLVNEVGNASKWEKFAELRVALGETLQPAMEILGSSMPDELGTYLEEWEEHNVFGGPSLILQIRRLYQNRKNATLTTIRPPSTAKISTQADNSNIATSAVKTEPSSSETSNAIEKNDEVNASFPPNENGAEASLEIPTNDDDEVYPGPDNDDEDIGGEAAKGEGSESTSKAIAPEDVPTKSPLPQKRNSFLNQQMEYDFESKGVPAGPVESREFLDPCKAITTLQIARDVRTNTAVEISTALANLPADILTACKDLESGKLQELDTATTNEFSIRIPSSLIDLDINEEMSSLNTFLDIIQRQQKARERLIYLLLKSRCDFGSMDAAREFHEVDDLAQKMKKRKEILSDALELEGLDTSEIVAEDAKTEKQGQEEELPPLTWYKPNESNKKPKVS
eukprot:jgi/Psemu1/240929/estExt_Genewise1.C_2030001